MDEISKLYDWIEINYKSLQISFCDYDNKRNINFTLYCVAMYAKHQSLM